MSLPKLRTIGDKFEDHVRGKLSHAPLVYAALGGAGMIIFWRGIWHSMDTLMEYLFTDRALLPTAIAHALPWWDGPLSLLIGIIILLSTGLFVSSFIGEAIILSGLKHEKKLLEKTEEEILAEIEKNQQLQRDIHAITESITRIEAAFQIPSKESSRPTKRIVRKK